MKKQIFKIEEAKGKQLLKIVTWVYGVILVFDDVFLHIHASHGYDGDIDYEFDDEIIILDTFDKESAIESTIVSSNEWDSLDSIRLAEERKACEELDRREYIEYQRLRAKYES